MNWFIEKSQMKYCNQGCPKKVGQCPVKNALNRYNSKYPDREIRWCPRCNGEFLGWKRIKEDKKVVERAVYTNGTVTDSGRTKKTRRYDFEYACDCDCGKERQKIGFRPYIFDGDMDDCYHQRKKNRFMRIEQRRNEKR